MANFICDNREVKLENQTLGRSFRHLIYHFWETLHPVNELPLLGQSVVWHVQCQCHEMGMLSHDLLDQFSQPHSQPSIPGPYMDHIICFGATYRENKDGPRTEPCGTPRAKRIGSDVSSPILTD
ncbi:uncharacterized protein [Montipora capricornis]|uniref:uncharacterized protein n=1 Tax=Montipora foliosa TaxID=591990 RepID=UPI0035F0FD08